MEVSQSMTRFAGFRKLNPAYRASEHGHGYVHGYDHGHEHVHLHDYGYGRRHG